jgi:cardiolipin synthase
VTRPWWLRGWRLAVICVIGAVAFFLLLAQDEHSLMVQSPVAVDEPRFAEYVASLVGAPVAIGDQYTVLRNGDEVFPPMLEAIRRAQRRISFESFIYEDGQIGDEFTRELAAAARRGVTVRVVLDSFGATLSREAQQQLTDAGVQVVWFNPLRPWTLEKANYRTHRKVLAVDGEVAFTGGIGLADHWLGNAQSPDHWRDTQFKVVGPSVRALEASFYENWLEAGGLSAPALDPELPPLDTGARSIVVWSNYSGGATSVKLLYLLSLAGARRTIDIQSPYFILDESTRWSIREARNRGVRVRVLTDSDETDGAPVKAASRAAYQMLLDWGVEIYEYQPTMMHAKTMMVDGVWSVIGSANFGNRSFELNDEVTVAVQDRELAATLINDFEDDIKRSVQFDAASWRQRSLWQRAQELFWKQYSELF